MGFVRIDDNRRAEIDEFHRMLLSCSAVVLKTSTEDKTNRRRLTKHIINEYTTDKKLVCVTSGVSFLGIAIVKQLVLRGYDVRIIVDNEEDIDRLREIEVSEEIEQNNNQIGIVVAKFSDPQSLMEAFDGCYTVFHTTAFIDPSGFSGYTDTTPEAEVLPDLITCVKDNQKKLLLLFRIESCM